MTNGCRVAILGAGPAGVGAAYRLRKLDLAEVVVLERNQSVGGLAASFELGGIHVDHGSHRLHPSCDPAILADIRSLLGEDLLDRPRHGRIRLRGRWIHFPLKPADLALRLPWSFAFGTAVDLARKAWPGSASGEVEESFASVLRRGLGTTICRDFYFPYAYKIWGRGPEELSAIQARRRVKASSLGKIFRKVLAASGASKSKGGGRFFYPRHGFGQIAEQLCRAASELGADFRLGATATSLELAANGRHTLIYEQNGEGCRHETDYIWSTLPLTSLARMIAPRPPSGVLDAAQSIGYRSMVLIYLVLAQERFSEFDAHYFPERHVPITRMSEPRNYSAVSEPRDRTVLCAELPCALGDAHWTMSDGDLADLVRGALADLGIPIRAPVVEVATRRLAYAYPIYHRGYEEHFERLDGWLNEQRNLLTLGRQGLFAHDNTHHTLAMAYAAVDCLQSTQRFDEVRWAGYRRIFEGHVVED